MPWFGRCILAFAALSCLTATGLGALASHAGAARLDAATLAAVDTAIAYQFYTSLGLLAVGVLADRHPDMRLLGAAGVTLAAGIVLFSGSIYAGALGAPDAIGGLAPAGGIAIMAGWALVAAAVLKLKPPG